MSWRRSASAGASVAGGGARECACLRAWLAAGALAVSAAGASGQSPSARDECGWTSLAERLGAAGMPDGSGVRVGQIEVGLPDEYAPGDADPEFRGLAIHATSGPSTPSQHATRVGAWFYGRDSGLAPAVAAVEAWEVLDWLGPGFLNGPGSEPPGRAGVDVLNHSWVGDIGAESGSYVRKLDAAIVEQGLFVVAGTANGPGPLDHPLLTHAYNAVSVGRADGWHAAGETLAWIDGPGRTKPELVAPAPVTSYAAPLVAGAAALLIQTAREHPNLSGNPRALEPAVLKAVLMAGARHRAGWWNGAFEHGAMRGATDRPLDPLYGADVLDVDASHFVLTAGEAPSAPDPLDAPLANASGWVRLDVAAGESHWVRLHVAGERCSASVVATWNRRVLPGFEAFELPDLDLELYAVDARGAPASLIGEAGIGRFGSGNVLSHSRVDNVEHLHVLDLAPGEYLLQVRRGFDSLPRWPVALAWRVAPPAPRAYGAAKPTSIGSEPTLAVRGLPESFEGGFTLQLEGGVPHQTGFVLESRAPGELPFRGGTLLVRTPVERCTYVRLDGRGALHLPVQVDAGSIESTLCFQVLFRDPGHPDGSGMGHSAGLAVRLGE